MKETQISFYLIGLNEIGQYMPSSKPKVSSVTFSPLLFFFLNRYFVVKCVIRLLHIKLIEKYSNEICFLY